MQTSAVQQKNLGFGISKQNFLAVSEILKGSGVAELSVKAIEGKGLKAALKGHDTLTQNGKPLEFMLPLAQDTVVFTENEGKKVIKESLMDKVLTGLADMVGIEHPIMERNTSLISANYIKKLGQ